MILTHFESKSMWRASESQTVIIICVSLCFYTNLYVKLCSKFAGN